jgi:hypothetical protein
MFIQLNIHVYENDTSVRYIKQNNTLLKPGLFEIVIVCYSAVRKYKMAQKNQFYTVRIPPVPNYTAMLHLILTNLFSLFFDVLQNFRNSASIFLVSDLTSDVSVLANFSTTVIHTAIQHDIYRHRTQNMNRGKGHDQFETHRQNCKLLTLTVATKRFADIFENLLYSTSVNLKVETT